MGSLLTQSTQSIYDVLIAVGYTMDNAISFIEQNQQIDNIDVDIYSLSDRNVSYIKMPEVPSDVVKQAVNPTSNIIFITAYNNQSIYDLSLNAYAGVDSIIKFINDNKINSIDEDSFNHKSFSYDINFIQDTAFYNQVTKRNKKIVTGQSLSVIEKFIISQTWKDVSGNYWLITVDLNDNVSAIMVFPTTDYIISQLWIDSNNQLWTVTIDTNGIFSPLNSGSGTPLTSEIWSNGAGLVQQTIDINGIFQFN